MKPAIKVDNISKCYQLGKGAATDRNLTENILHKVKSLGQLITGQVGSNGGANEFWALKDVSFEVQPGEVVGFVGRNGAGKSTLLKILSRIVEPTSGRAEVRGRLGSLLEVGTGMHPELNGRENIFLNGSILGMTHREIKSKFDQIVAFADMDRFLDTPVKRYSSGMFVRLAFAIAAHLQPEVLIVDEVLAVGDSQFQKKCLGKMKDVSAEGRTVLFVSHDMTAVRMLCTRAAMFSKGQLVNIGPTAEIVNEYMARESMLTAPGQTIDLSNSRHTGTGAVRLAELKVDAADGGAGPITSGGPLHAEVIIEAKETLMADSLSLTVSDRTGFRLVHADTVRLGKQLMLYPGKNKIEIQMKSLNLQAGSYTLGLWVGKWPDVCFDAVDYAGDIEVVPAASDGTVKPINDGSVRCDFDVLASKT